MFRYLLLVSSFLSLIVGFTANAMAFDHGDTDDYLKPCPPEAVLQMDSQFGYGTSALTTCLQKRTNVKSAVAWNSAQTNKSGVAQQALVTTNLISNYENVYGMVLNKNYKVVVVAYSAGGRWLLSDEAYNRTFNVDTGNPTRAVVEQLIAKGIPVYMCQNTMRSSGWVTSDLIPGTQMVPAGVAALLDFQSLGYNQITP